MAGTVWSFDGRKTTRQGEIRKYNIKEIKDISKDFANPLKKPNFFTSGKSSWPVETKEFHDSLRNSLWTLVRDQERHKTVMKVYMRDKEKMLMPSKRKPRGPNKNLAYTPKKTNSRPNAPKKNKDPSQPHVKPKRGRKKLEPPILERIQNPYNQELESIRGQRVRGAPHSTGAPGKSTATPGISGPSDAGPSNQSPPRKVLPPKAILVALADHDYFLPLPPKVLADMEETDDGQAAGAPTNSGGEDTAVSATPNVQGNKTALVNPTEQQEPNATEHQDLPEQSSPVEQFTANLEHLALVEEQSVGNQEEPMPHPVPPVSYGKEQEAPTKKLRQVAEESVAPAETNAEQNVESRMNRQENGQENGEQQRVIPPDPIKITPHYNLVPLELFWKSSKKLVQGQITAVVPHEDYGDNLLGDFFWLEYTPEQTVKCKISLAELPAEYYRYIGFNKDRVTKTDDFLEKDINKYRAIAACIPKCPIYMWTYYTQEANLIVIEDIAPLHIEADPKELFKFRLFVEDIIDKKKPEETIVVITRRWTIYHKVDMIYFISARRTTQQGTYRDYALGRFPQLKLYMDSRRELLRKKYARAEELPIAPEDQQMVDRMVEEFKEELPKTGLRFLELKDDRPEVLQRVAAQTYKMYREYLAEMPSSSAHSAPDEDEFFAPVVWLGIDSCPKDILDSFITSRMCHIKQEFAFAILYLLMVNEVMEQSDGLLVLENLYIPNLWDDIVLEYFVGFSKIKLQEKIAQTREEQQRELDEEEFEGLDEDLINEIDESIFEPQDEEEELIEDLDPPEDKS